MLISSVPSVAQFQRRTSPAPLRFGTRCCNTTLAEHCDNLSIPAKTHLTKHIKKYLTLATVISGVGTGYEAYSLKSSCENMGKDNNIGLCFLTTLGTILLGGLSALSVYGWGKLLCDKFVAPRDEIDDDESVVSAAPGNAQNVPADLEAGINNPQAHNAAPLPNVQAVPEEPDNALANNAAPPDAQNAPEDPEANL